MSLRIGGAGLRSGSYSKGPSDVGVGFVHAAEQKRGSDFRAHVSAISLILLRSNKRFYVGKMSFHSLSSLITSTEIVWFNGAASACAYRVRFVVTDISSNRRQGEG